MIRSTLLYVVSVAGPAMLLAIAVDAVRSRRVRTLETLAWFVTTGALLVALVYPSLLSTVGVRIGITVPVGLVGFVGIGGLFVGYVRQRERVAELESRVRELEGANSVDVDAAEDTDQPVASPTDQERVVRRRGDSTHA